MSRKTGDGSEGFAPGRRDFFRQLMISAIEGAEKLGKQMSKRHAFPFDFEEEPERPTCAPPESWRHFDPKYQVHGPPWPAPCGPPVPQELRRRLRAERQRRVSRSTGAAVPPESPPQPSSREGGGGEGTD